MAKSAALRKQEQRERDKLTEQERLSRLLSRTIELQLFKRTDMALIRCMARAQIDEPQDLITRLIHGADRLHDSDLAVLTGQP